MRDTPRLWMKVLGGVCLGALALPVLVSAQAGPNARFSEFLGLTDAELQSVQVKLTWVGVQAESVPTTAFAETVDGVDLTLFAPFYRPDFEYGNDALPSDWIFAATLGELRSVLDALAGVPAVVASEVTAEELLSVALLRVNRDGEIRVAESVLGSADAVAAIAAIRSGLSNASPGQAHLEWLRRIVLGED